MTNRRLSIMNAVFHGAIIALSLGICLRPTTVLAETTHFQQGLRDCLAAVVSRDSSRLGRNAVVEGTLESGIVARYPHGSNGRSYAVQLHEQPEGTPEAGVWICHGPPALGPLLAEYIEADMPSLRLLVSSSSLRELNVDQPAYSFADCDSGETGTLMAIFALPTGQVGFQVMAAPAVIQVCDKFGFRKDRQ